MAGISGSQLAPLYAMFGTMRFGATRFGYHSPKVFVSVAGIQRANAKPTAADKLEDLVINESTAASPNTASFQASGGWEPAMGDEVIVTLGSINRTRRLFAGTVLSVGESSIGTPDYRVVTANCVDWTWLLDTGPEKVLGHFTGSATDIALELMSTYAPAGFTVTQVEAGLPIVPGGITFTNVDLSVALERLARRIGAKQRIDYDQDLYFRLTPLAIVTPPRTLVVGLDTLKAITSVRRDLSQCFTRVPMEGGGANAACDVPVGETILPLTDAPEWWYGDFGGEVICGPQRLSYTGRQAGNGGSLVGPGAAPLVAPVLALAAGSGVTAGDHDVAVVFVTAAGKSLAGPKATITTGTTPAPASAPVAGSPVSGVGPDPGEHYYAITEVTAAGETTPSPVSNTVTTVAGIADPTVAPTAPTAPATTGFGDLVNGHVYSYKYTWGDDSGGETLPSPASATATVGAAQRLATGFPSSTDSRCTRIYLYRSANGGGAPWTRVGLIFAPASSTGNPYYPNVSGVFWTVDDSKTPLVSAAPTVSTAKSNKIPLTDLAPASPLGTSRNLYGTAAGGSQLKLVAALNTTDSSYLVTTLDASLGANAPTVNTAAAGQITTSAPLGPVTTTAREFYMNPIAGGARKLALTISNNTTEIGTITASDATLAAAGAEPSSDTSGLAQPTGHVLAGATSIPVAGLGGENGFQADGGWAVVGNGQIVVRYTGITGNTLTGVPATGDGSIGATIPYNSLITAAPALTGMGAPIASQQLGFNNVRYFRLLTGTPTDRLGQLFQTGVRVRVNEITLELDHSGGPAGNVWITIQTGAITEAGTVLATSALVNAASITGLGNTSFTFATPVTLEPGSYYFVLQGDYARSDSVFLIAHGSSVPPQTAYEYDGTTVSPMSTIHALKYQVLAVPQPILYPLKKGDPVNLWVTVDDLDAQASLSSLLDPDDVLGGAAGIRVAPPLQDRRKSRAECLAQAAAFLSLRKSPNVTLSYRSKDTNTVAGADVTANLEPPTSVNDDFKIQTVTISNFTMSIPPDYVVQASDELFSVEDLLTKGEP